MKLIDKVRENFLLRLASLNSVNVFIRLVFGLVSSKFIAVFVGVEGMAFIGNLRNFLSTIQSFSILGLSNGIVKYVSEFRNNKKELEKMLSTILIVVLFTSLIGSSIIYFKRDYFNSYLFGHSNVNNNVILAIALTVPFVALNLVFLAVIKGFSKFKKYLYINIFSQFLAIGITLFLIYKYELKGALYAVVFSPAIILIITLIFLLKNKLIVSYFNLKSFQKKSLTMLSSFSIMSLFSAFFIPLVAIEIRNHIIETVDVTSAGCWETMQRISRYYLMFVTSLISLYILPKFSTITNSLDFKKEVWNFYKTVLPIFAFILLLIYLLRKVIISIVFTDEFLPTKDLFLWQLLGDFVKVATMVISIQLLAKKMTLQYLVTEAISLFSLYFLSIYFIDELGVKGATFAHFLNFCFYLVIVVFVFRKLLFSKENVTI